MVILAIVRMPINMHAHLLCAARLLVNNTDDDSWTCLDFIPAVNKVIRTGLMLLARRKELSNAYVCEALKVQSIRVLRVAHVAGDGWVLDECTRVCGQSQPSSK